MNKPHCSPDIRDWGPQTGSRFVGEHRVTTRLMVDTTSLLNGNYGSCPISFNQLVHRVTIRLLVYEPTYISPDHFRLTRSQTSAQHRHKPSQKHTGVFESKRTCPISATIAGCKTVYNPVCNNVYTVHTQKAQHPRMMDPSCWSIIINHYPSDIMLYDG